MILAATGHRPDAPGMGGFDRDAFRRLRSFARVCLEALAPTELYDGLALGWDHACLLAAFDLDIPVIGALPYEGFDSKWRPESRAWLKRMMAKCKRVHTCCKGFSRASYQIRNEYMVDNSDQLLALFSGKPGGTHNCIRYAEREIPSLVTGQPIATPKPVENTWSDWLAYSRSAA